jgi:hypothetical protein
VTAASAFCTHSCCSRASAGDRDELIEALPGSFRINRNSEQQHAGNASSNPASEQHELTRCCVCDGSDCPSMNRSATGCTSQACGFGGSKNGGLALSRVFCGHAWLRFAATSSGSPLPNQPYSGARCSAGQLALIVTLSLPSPTARARSPIG